MLAESLIPFKNDDVICLMLQRENLETTPSQLPIRKSSYLLTVWKLRMSTSAKLTDGCWSTSDCQPFSPFVGFPHQRILVFDTTPAHAFIPHTLPREET